MGSNTPALVNYLLTPRAKLNGMLLFCRTNTEHLSPTCRACPLSSWPTVLHGYGSCILHFPFGMALDAVCLHLFNSSFRFIMNNRPFVVPMSIAHAN